MSKWTDRAWTIYQRLRAELDEPHRTDVKDLYDLLLNEIGDARQGKETPSNTIDCPACGDPVEEFEGKRFCDCGWSAT